MAGGHGIHTVGDLRRVGAVPAYAALKRSYGRVSLNLLYALVGAVDDMHWREVKRRRRLELLLQLDDYARDRGTAR